MRSVYCDYQPFTEVCLLDDSAVASDAADSVNATAQVAFVSEWTAEFQDG